jgi:hypothetical protein
MGPWDPGPTGYGLLPDDGIGIAGEGCCGSSGGDGPCLLWWAR